MVKIYVVEADIALLFILKKSAIISNRVSPFCLVQPNEND
jgi:hypothetical protein